MAEQSLPRFGRRHRPPPSRALEQLQAGCSLEHRDLLADRGLRVAELRAGAAERAGLHDGLERRQVADLDAHQAMTVS